MKRIAYSVVLAGMTALALGACTNTGMRGDTARASDMIDGEYGSTADVSSGSAATGAAQAGSVSSTGASAAAGTDQAGQSDAMAGAPNSTVTNIEVIPRQSGSADTGAGTVAGAAVGSSGAAGTTGGSMSSDRVYRITLRMDDGTVRTITQESTPAFSSGDRVQLSGGAIVP